MPNSAFSQGFSGRLLNSRRYSACLGYEDNHAWEGSRRTLVASVQRPVNTGEDILSFAIKNERKVKRNESRKLKIEFSMSVVVQHVLC